ncbi:YigZ family protein [Treponema maltophilum]|uniref:YigZ family protein n=1 Tax=Treponema maltophilum TaxID=51160 RepID=UPI003D91C93F
MNILLESACSETLVKKSRFIAEIFPVKNQRDVRALLKTQKQKYADSSHVVHAFALGKSAEIMGMSDDGEPAGTAGRPVLAVLKGSGCTDILLTVTRYFGGTLLGTGGLVKAYTQAAQSVLALAHTEVFAEREEFDLRLSYEDYETCKRLFKKFGVKVGTEDFAENVHISGCIETALKEDFERELRDSLGGKNPFL